MTLEAISNDLLMREKAKMHNPEIVQKRRSLPVFNHRDEILKIIEENSVVLIKGKFLSRSCKLEFKYG
jgi:HrpA-like RNA helicase